MADQGSQGLLSSFLRTQRLKAAKHHLRGRVLDFGCGSGAIAEFVEPTRYEGYDLDPASVSEARRRFPKHDFQTTEPAPDEQFDTVVLLAVLEHVSDPSGFLRMLSGFLRPDGRLVLTTPHPSMEWAHTAGARVRLFSHDAHEEHETLLDRKMIEQVAGGAGLAVENYRRFLLGANQLAVLRRA